MSFSKLPVMISGLSGNWKDNISTHRGHNQATRTGRSKFGAGMPLDTALPSRMGASWLDMFDC